MFSPHLSENLTDLRRRDEISVRSEHVVLHVITLRESFTLINFLQTFIFYILHFNPDVMKLPVGRYGDLLLGGY